MANWNRDEFAAYGPLMTQTRTATGTGSDPLPPGWSWRADGALAWRQEHGPWRVEMACSPGAPFSGPYEMKVWLDAGGDATQEAMDAAEESDGIPSALLNRLPLAEIKQTARRLVAEASPEPPWPVPKRCATDEDFALLAAELVRIKATGASAPQQVLADRLGVGKATMSERVKRARGRGLLATDRIELTDKAREFLAALGDPPAAG
ncbi:hypothetical protein ACIRPK_30365 [Kitasatospora sp. NPDC101801]|uniref:hypothetical protein n=1 Tax=Kitasatospora sp. NPDC101801 TaxID=3364103 RepID=UPI003825CC09